MPIVNHFDPVDGFFWSETADWVGRTITLQMGIQSTDVEDEYHVYLAGTPKADLFPVAGDPSEAEFAWFNTTKAATLSGSKLTIKKKDLARSCIVIGGAWLPDDPNANATRGYGYSQLNCPMIVDEVRVFFGAAPGKLPTTNGGIPSAGKLNSARALPAQRLEQADMLRRLGASLETANVTDGSVTVETPGSGRFFPGLPADTIDAIQQTLLFVSGDDAEVMLEGLIPELLQEFYFIADVATDGTSLTLSTPYSGATRRNAGCFSVRLCGYTSFEDDLYLKVLTLGEGKEYDPTNRSVDDAHETSVFWQNEAPVEAEWRLRIYSPLGHSSAGEILPSWVRGLGRPRKNPILGLSGVNEDLFAVARGSLFQMDDRWREDGPTEVLTRSLSFLGRAGRRGVLLPRENDRLYFTAGAPINVWPYATVALSAGMTWVIDAWVFPRSAAGLQTIAWHGQVDTDPAIFPSSNNNGRGFGWWLRLNGGRPELVRQTASSLAVGGQPEDGRWTALGSEPLPLGRWSHLRVYLAHSSDQGGFTVVEVPVFTVNGIPIATRINGQDTFAAALGSAYWIRANNGGGPNPLGTNTIFVLGAARDSYRDREEDEAFMRDFVGGDLQRPDRIAGWVHSLHGSLSDVAVWRATNGSALVSGKPAFQPRSIDYAAVPDLFFRATLQEGVGHRVLETGFSGTGGHFAGLIVSHPAISLLHELGMDDEMASMAEHGKRLFVTTGARPAQIDTDRDVLDPLKSTLAGLLPPSTKPTVEFERFPLWETNRATGAITDTDPILGKNSAGEPIYHFSHRGNSWLRGEYQAELDWTRNATAGTWSVFGFKCYFRLRSTAGRISLWGRRSSTKAGGVFIEVRDGFLYVGWFDPALKKEVWVKTSSAVVRPGRLYYLRVRKNYPIPDGGPFWTGQTKWQNQVAVMTGAFSLDQIVLREFQLVAPSASYQNWPTYGAKDTAAAYVFAEHSFTTEDYTITGLTCTGLVTPNDSSVFFKGDGATAGRLLTDNGAGVAFTLFTRDMLGMRFQFASGALAGKVYRIVTFVSASEVTITEEYTGTQPVIGTGIVLGGVCFGLALIKEEDLDLSLDAEQGAYDPEFFGTELAGIESNGFARFDGEYTSFAVGVKTTSTGQNVDLFDSFAATHTDDGRIGADWFEEQLYSATGTPGELMVDPGGRCHLAVHTQPYTGSPVAAVVAKITPQSTKPNEKLEVALDAESSANARTLVFRHHEEPDELDGEYRIRVCFHSRDQLVTSMPGPEIIARPEGEDRTNPSGLVRILLTALPISRDQGEIERWVYMSLADGANLFRQLIIPENVSTSVGLTRRQARIPDGPVLEFNNSPPPRARALGSSQNRLWYGDILLPNARRRSPDLLAYSEPYEPTVVPLGNLLPIKTGANEPIVALGEMKGRLLVLKRNFSGHATVRGGIVFFEVLSKQIGCLARQSLAVLEDRAYWLHDRGIYVWTGAGIPALASHKIETFFTSRTAQKRVDRRKLPRASAAIHTRTNSYEIALQQEGDKDPRTRIGMEFDHELAGETGGPGGRMAAGHRHSRYRDPLVTALGTVRPKGGGSKELVAGTVHGHVLYMDREDSNLHGLGEDAARFGAASATVSSASGTQIVLTSAVLDQNLDSLAGSVVRWLAAGVEFEAVIHFVRSGIVHLDRVVSVLPAGATVIEVGRMLPFFQTKWFSNETPEADKHGQFIDLVFRVETAGTLIVHGLVDFSATSNRMVTRDGVEMTLDLTKGLMTIPSGTMRGTFFAFRVFTRTGTPAPQWELLELIQRITDADQR